MTTLVGTSKSTIKANFIQHYPLLAFFLLAFGLTWIFMIADALGSHEVLPFRLPLPLMIVMGYMPTLAAVIVTGMTKGKTGIRALFGKLLMARVGWRWYAIAIFGLPVIYIGTIALYNAMRLGPALSYLSEKTPPFASPLELIPQIILLFLIVGLVNGEELAWRGFALPRLQTKYSALTSSLILGVIWSLFHLPLFFTLTGSSQTDWSFSSFLLSTIGITILYTWIYNNTRGSVLLAYLFHAAANTWTQVFSIDHANQMVNWILTGVMVLVAIVVVLTAGAENLSRTRFRIQE